MAKRNFIIDLDLNQNELLKARVENLASSPGTPTPVSGQIYYDTTLNQIGIYNSNTTSWDYLDTGSLTDITGDTVTGITVSVSGGVATVSGLQAIGGQDGYMLGTDKDKLDDSTNLNTPDTLVERDGSGDFSANDITANSITGLVSPTLGSDATNKDYVDSIASGLDPKASARLISNANITSTGSGAGVGATLTTGQTSITIDSISVVDGDRVVINGQTDQSENGIYDVSGVGVDVVFTRSTDFDGDPANEINGGEFVFITEGTVNADSGWVVSTPDSTITVDTDIIEFSQFSSQGVITAGDGLTKVGNIIDFVTNDNSLTVNANDVLVNVDDTTIETDVTNGIQVVAGGITGTQLNTSVAGDGLAGGGGSSLSVNTDDTTIEILTDTIQIVDSGVGVTQISGAIAGAGLTGGDGTPLSIGSDSTITVNVNDIKVADSGITGTQLNTSVAGAGLAGGGGTPLSVNVSNGLNIDVDDVQLGGTLDQNTIISGNVGTYNLSLTDLNQFDLSFDQSVITDNAAGEGLVYSADYTPTFVTHSLISKQYVDEQISNVPTGDITDVTAGNGLTGGGTTGAVTLDVNTDGNFITTATDQVTIGNYTSRVGSKSVSLVAGVTSSITHNFNTQNVQVSLYDSGTKEELEAYIEATTVNTIDIISNSTENVDVIISGNVAEAL